MGYVMQIDFLSTLHVENVGKYTWRVMSDFIVGIYEGEETRCVLRVPQGFVTDFASVPRLPFAYWIAGNRAPKAATVHDYLYATKAGRDFADDVFYYAMLAEGTKKWIAKLMWAGVRFGGARRYDAR